MTIAVKESILVNQVFHKSNDTLASYNVEVDYFDNSKTKFSITNLEHEIVKRLTQSYLYIDNFIFFDVETTGLNTDNDLILQVSWHRWNCNSTNIISDFHYRTFTPSAHNFFISYNPEKIINGAEFINHINLKKLDEMVGADPEIVRIDDIPSILKKLEDFTLGEKTILIGHNIREFDIPMLMAMFKRTGMDDKVNQLNATKTLDTLELARSYDRLGAAAGGNGSGKLINYLTDFYKNEIDSEDLEMIDRLTRDLHDSRADICVNGALLNLICKFIANKN